MTAKKVNYVKEAQEILDNELHSLRVRAAKNILRQIERNEARYKEEKSYLEKELSKVDTMTFESDECKSVDSRF